MLDCFVGIRGAPWKLDKGWATMGEDSQFTGRQQYSATAVLRTNAKRRACVDDIRAAGGGRRRFLGAPTRWRNGHSDDHRDRIRLPSSACRARFAPTTRTRDAPGRSSKSVKNVAEIANGRKTYYYVRCAVAIFVAETCVISASAGEEREMEAS